MITLTVLAVLAGCSVVLLICFAVYRDRVVQEIDKQVLADGIAVKYRAKYRARYLHKHCRHLERLERLAKKEQQTMQQTPHTQRVGDLF